MKPPLAVEAWNKRMLGFQGPAQPSPALRLEMSAERQLARMMKRKRR
jgi:hypothetical protein